MNHHTYLWPSIEITNPIPLPIIASTNKIFATPTIALPKVDRLPLMSEPTIIPETNPSSRIAVCSPFRYNKILPSKFVANGLETVHICSVRAAALSVGPSETNRLRRWQSADARPLVSYRLDARARSFD
jgi:hypothetical protein